MSLKYLSVVWIFLLATIVNAAPQIPANPDTTIIIGTNKITVEDAAVVKANTIFQYNPPKSKGDIANKANVKNIEKLLSQKVDIRLRSKDDVASRATLFYKIGSYYLHDGHDPDTAIKNMLLADHFLKDSDTKYSNYNNLASAYTLKYEHTHKSDDKQNAMRYSEMVIHKYKNLSHPQLAFAYCVRGKIFSIENKSTEAQKYYDQALAIYQKTNKDINNYVPTSNGARGLDTNQKYSLLYNYCQIGPTLADSYCQEQII